MYSRIYAYWKPNIYYQAKNYLIYFTAVARNIETNERKFN